ncbi:putative transposase B, IS609, partial [Escherichia coli SHECO001]
NWQKQKRKIQRLHSRIANIRRDYLHKVTTTVSKNHAMIVIEDLKVSNMSKSAAGTVSQPGRNVRAKSGLNRSILDQGWYEMRRQLEYKQLWRGGQVLAVPPAYTSQRCACCGHTAKENRLSQSKFRCQVCGYTANADVNGARNILAAGHAVLACGEMVQSGRFFFLVEAGTHRNDSGDSLNEAGIHVLQGVEDVNISVWFPPRHWKPDVRSSKRQSLAGFWLTLHLPRTNKTAIRLAGKQDLLIIPRING